VSGKGIIIALAFPEKALSTGSSCMKKLDKFIIKAFIGPFLLTFAVLVFIFLTQTIIKYFEYLVGKGLGVNIFVELLFNFSLYSVPVALPLAVLLSSLMTYGNLGEHYELTAIKSAGISLVRVLLPVFIFSVLITLAAFWFNNHVVPKANLKAFSLLWDVKQKKPSLSIKEGIFYKDLPDMSIKVNKKLPDEKTLLDVIIYDHQEHNGNTRVILADSAQMYTIMSGRYLIFELFNGQSFDDYSAGSRRGNDSNDQFMRNRFKKSKRVIDLSSFDMGETPEELFSNHRWMKNVDQLRYAVDSLQKEVTKMRNNVNRGVSQYYSYHLRPVSVSRRDTVKGAAIAAGAWADSLGKAKVPVYQQKDIYSRAANQARSVRAYTESSQQQMATTLSEQRTYAAEKHRRYTQSVACFIMFLIGAPLGSIIKKGGLGMPVLISIMFFIIFYVFSMLGEKWAREGMVPIAAGVWGGNFILFWVGMFFLRQARNDSRLLEADAYRIAFNRLKRKFRRQKTRPPVPAGV
jgi:lipopolysaccharide export system permease protein